MKVVKLGLHLLADKLIAVTIWGSILLACFLAAGEYVFFFEEEIHNGIYLENELPHGQKRSWSRFRAYSQPKVLVELENGRRISAIYDLKLGPTLQHSVRVKEIRGGITGSSEYYVIQIDSNP